VKTDLKAVVFKTSRLRETKNFFETIPGMKIRESSLTHFVIYAEGLRVLFVESNNTLEVELYLSKKSAEVLTVREDPNQIKIIVS
jgi:catechol-2,3-dioxygenase